MKIISKLLLLTCVTLLFGCGENKKVSHHHFKKEKHKVLKTMDGRYVYQDNGGFWFYYMLWSSQSNSNYYYTNSLNNSIPLNGGWIPSGNLSIPKIEEGEEPIEEEIEIQPNGEPATPEMVQTEFDFNSQSNVEEESNNNESMESETPESSSSSESSTSSDSSSSSSDSGGGDSGGSSD